VKATDPPADRTYRPAPDPGIELLLAARHHDPFAVLGRHALPGGGSVVRIFRPATVSAELPEIGASFERVGDTDLFEYRGDVRKLPDRYRVRWRTDRGETLEQVDAYCFTPQLPESEIGAFNSGQHWHAWWLLGAHAVTVDGVAGTRFAVWAPEAERVSVVGEFNRWDGRCHRCVAGAAPASGSCSSRGSARGNFTSTRFETAGAASCC